MTSVGGSQYPANYYNYIYSYLPPDTQTIPSGDASLIQMANHRPQVRSQEPPKQEKPGFFDKVGAVIKGVADAPGKLVGGLVETVTKHPEKLLLGAGIIAASFIPVIGPVIAIGATAYFAGQGALAVAEGAGQMADAWARDDLQGLRDAAGNTTVAGVTTAISVAGLRMQARNLFTTQRQLFGTGAVELPARQIFGRGLAAKTINSVDDIGYLDALRLTPRIVTNGFRQFHTDYIVRHGGWVNGLRQAGVETLDRYRGFAREIAEPSIQPAAQGPQQIQPATPGLEAIQPATPAAVPNPFLQNAQNTFNNAATAYGIYNTQYPGVLQGTMPPILVSGEERPVQYNYYSTPQINYQYYTQTPEQVLNTNA